MGPWFLICGFKFAVARLPEVWQKNPASGKFKLKIKGIEIMSTSKKTPAASVVWFEIPADDVARAKNFYGKLFGWKMAKMDHMSDYWHIDTGGHDKSPDGGLMKRQHPNQPVTNYITVPSVTRYMAKVKKLGGQICVEKTAVPQMGYFAVCMDTEKNVFALWELSDKAK